MEPIKIKKRAKTVPFGFKESNTPGYLEPVKEELEALNQAKDYLKNCSLRETASWLHRKTGRYISHVGLKKRIERSSTTETKESSSTESQEVNTTDSSSQS
tara:strand:+ start:353 stop:655 length:303 start_codon:yes stop_codon:yes gene_type:complete